MIRIIFGVICLFAAAIVWAAPDETASAKAQMSVVYAAIGAPLVYFGRRARRRKRAASDVGDAEQAAKVRREAVSADEKTKNKALEKACRAGQVETVRALIEAGADVNWKDWAENTPLTAAIYAKHLDVVELLLQHGASLKVPEHEPPLMAAAKVGRVDLVRALITGGADVNWTSDEGSAPLETAALLGHTQVVRALIDAGAKVDHADRFGRSAMYRSGNALLIGKKPDIVVELIDADAELSGYAYPNKASLWASGPDTSSPFKWEVPLDLRDKAGNTLLMIAAARGRRRAVERLLAEKVPIDAINKAGETALTLARTAGHTDIEQLLMTAGAVK